MELIFVRLHIQPVAELMIRYCDFPVGLYTIVVKTEILL